MDAASNPQPYFRMLRDSGPVLPSDAERPTIVSRHADVLSVLRTPEVFSSNADAAFIGQVRPLIPLQIDPPEHSKYRKLLDPLFAPKRIAELEPASRRIR